MMYDGDAIDQNHLSLRDLPSHEFNLTQEALTPLDDIPDSHSVSALPVISKTESENNKKEDSEKNLQPNRKKSEEYKKFFKEHFSSEAAASEIVNDQLESAPKKQNSKLSIDISQNKQKHRSLSPADVYAYPDHYPFDQYGHRIQSSNVGNGNANIVNTYKGIGDDTESVSPESLNGKDNSKSSVISKENQAPSNSRFTDIQFVDRGEHTPQKRFRTDSVTTPPHGKSMQVERCDIAKNSTGNADREGTKVVRGNGQSSEASNNLSYNDNRMTAFNRSDTAQVMKSWKDKQILNDTYHKRDAHKDNFFDDFMRSDTLASKDGINDRAIPDFRATQISGSSMASIPFDLSYGFFNQLLDGRNRLVDKRMTDEHGNARKLDGTTAHNPSSGGRTTGNRENDLNPNAPGYVCGDERCYHPAEYVSAMGGGYFPENEDKKKDNNIKNDKSTKKIYDKNTFFAGLKKKYSKDMIDSMCRDDISTHAKSEKYADPKMKKRLSINSNASYNSVRQSRRVVSNSPRNGPRPTYKTELLEQACLVNQNYSNQNSRSPEMFSKQNQEFCAVGAQNSMISSPPRSLRHGPHGTGKFQHGHGMHASHHQTGSHNLHNRRNHGSDGSVMNNAQLSRSSYHPPSSNYPKLKSRPSKEQIMDAELHQMTLRELLIVATAGMMRGTISFALVIKATPAGAVDDPLRLQAIILIIVYANCIILGMVFPNFLKLVLGSGCEEKHIKYRPLNQIVFDLKDKVVAWVHEKTAPMSSSSRNYQSGGTLPISNKDEDGRTPIRQPSLLGDLEQPSLFKEDLLSRPLLGHQAIAILTGKNRSRNTDGTAKGVDTLNLLNQKPFALNWFNPYATRDPPNDLIKLHRFYTPAMVHLLNTYEKRLSCRKRKIGGHPPVFAADLKAAKLKQKLCEQVKEDAGFLVKEDADEVEETEVKNADGTVIPGKKAKKTEVLQTDKNTGLFIKEKKIVVEVSGPKKEGVARKPWETNRKFLEDCEYEEMKRDSLDNSKLGNLDPFRTTSNNSANNNSSKKKTVMYASAHDDPFLNPSCLSTVEYKFDKKDEFCSVKPTYDVNGKFEGGEYCDVRGEDPSNKYKFGANNNNFLTPTLSVSDNMNALGEPSNSREEENTDAKENLMTPNQYSCEQDEEEIAAMQNTNSAFFGDNSIIRGGRVTKHADVHVIGKQASKFWMDMDGNVLGTQNISFGNQGKKKKLRNEGRTQVLNAKGQTMIKTTRKLGSKGTSLDLEGNDDFEGHDLEGPSTLSPRTRNDYFETNVVNSPNSRMPWQRVWSFENIVPDVVYGWLGELENPNAVHSSDEENEFVNDKKSSKINSKENSKNAIVPSTAPSEASFDNPYFMGPNTFNRAENINMAHIPLSSTTSATSNYTSTKITAQNDFVPEVIPMGSPFFNSPALSPSAEQRTGDARFGQNIVNNQVNNNGEYDTMNSDAAMKRAAELLENLQRQNEKRDRAERKY